MQPNDAARCATRHGTHYPDDGDVVVRVEHTLYRLHSFHLRRSTTYFNGMLATDDSDATKDSGSDEHPLVLEGVESLDFENLLWFFYESAYKWSGIIDPHLTPKWESVLLLAEKFNMKQVAKVACYALGRAGVLSDVRKIALGVKHGLGEDWILEELKRILTRESPFSIEEGRELGLDTVVILAASRETRALQAGGVCATGHCPECRDTMAISCANGWHTCQNGFQDTVLPSLPCSLQHSPTSAEEVLTYRKNLRYDFFVKLESTVLGVHSYHLERASSVFADMLALPTDGVSREGKTRDHPLVLDTKLRYFESLLWFLYDSPYQWSSKPNTSVSPRWEDVLIVADMFNMEEVCRVATYALDHNGMLPDIRRISLCVRHSIDKAWALDAIRRVCIREQALNKDEAREVGLDMAMLIASAREAAYKASGGKISVHASAIDDVIRNALLEGRERQDM
ncbi:hypothetical protein EV714DRAFT_286902 [Schizophyllum commune]